MPLGCGRRHLSVAHADARQLQSSSNSVMTSESTSSICAGRRGRRYRPAKSASARFGDQIARLENFVDMSRDRHRDCRMPSICKPPRSGLGPRPEIGWFAAHRGLHPVSDAGCGGETPGRWSKGSPVSARHATDRALSALFVHDDADDFDVVGSRSSGTTASESAICGTAAGETKLTASICVNPGIDEFAQIIGLDLGRDVAGSPCHASRGHSTILTALPIPITAPARSTGRLLQLRD